MALPSMPDLDDDLDRVVDALARIFERGRQLIESEAVGVDELGIEALLLHQSHGAMRGALTFAPDAINIDVVANEVGEIDRDGLMRESGETDAPAAVDHLRRLIHR